MASAAGALLRKNLTKSNRWRYAMRGSFSVRGGISKMLYHLDGPGRLSVETADDGVRGFVCVRVRDGTGLNVPTEDWMLAITLMAQHDEERLLSVGHCGNYPLHRGGCALCREFLVAKEKLEEKKKRRKR